MGRGGTTNIPNVPVNTINRGRTGPRKLLPNARNVLYNRVSRYQARARWSYFREIKIAGLVLYSKGSEKLRCGRVRPEVEGNLAKLGEGNATTRSGVEDRDDMREEGLDQEGQR